jgi:hypothetical protein
MKINSQTIQYQRMKLNLKKEKNKKLNSSYLSTDPWTF